MGGRGDLRQSEPRPDELLITTQQSTNHIMTIIKHDINSQTKKEITRDQAKRELGEMWEPLMESGSVSCGLTIWEVKQ